MDESGISSYTYGVIRLRFLAVVLAFVLPVFGCFPASAKPRSVEFGSDVSTRSMLLRSPLLKLWPDFCRLS